MKSMNFDPRTLRKFTDLLALSVIPFKNFEGISKLRILIKYFNLAVHSHGYTEIHVHKTDLQSKAWRNFQKYLYFQLKFITPTYWTKTPLMIAVSGGYSFIFPLKLDSIKKSDDLAISKIARLWEQSFDGFDIENYAHWLRLNLALSRSNTIFRKTDLNSNLSIVEIGPGFGGFMTISSEISKSKYYSYDTYEMQLVQKSVIANLNIDKDKINYVATNLSTKHEKELPLPNEAYSVFAFWSFTEIHQPARSKFLKLLKNAQEVIIVSNLEFEFVNNHSYLLSLKDKLGKKLNILSLESILGSQIPNYMKNHKVYCFQNE